MIFKRDSFGADMVADLVNAFHAADNSTILTACAVGFFLVIALGCYFMDRRTM